MSVLLIINNPRETFRSQTRAAYQRPIDVFSAHQSGHVVRFDRTAVENPQRLRRTFRMPFRENAPDKRVHFLRLLRRRGASSSDGPYRLVGKDNTVEVRGCQPTESST